MPLITRLTISSWNVQGLFKRNDNERVSKLNDDDTITSLRSVTNKNFLIPKPKLNLFKNSLSYSGAIIWNSIPLEIKTSKSLDSFVNKCKAWKKQGYFV